MNMKEARQAFIERRIPFSFDAQTRAIGITYYNGRPLLTTSTKHGKLLRIVGLSVGNIALNTAPQHADGKAFILEVVHGGYKAFYQFHRIKAAERKKLFEELQKQ
ncbi:MAG: hypothetical protein N3G80_01205 [Candidatus Micrarchaeota archaeon]|nr:hypothetical protein [Candidatus Micrarchaeota archaeon]